MSDRIRKRLTLSPDTNFKLETFASDQGLSPSEVTETAILWYMQMKELDMEPESFESMRINQLTQAIEKMTLSFSSDTQMILNKLDAIAILDQNVNYLKDR